MRLSTANIIFFGLVAGFSLRIIAGCVNGEFNPVPQLEPQHAVIRCRAEDGTPYGGRIINDRGPPLPIDLMGTWTCTSTQFSEAECRVTIP